jgi:enterochelin esterase family protein
VGEARAGQRFWSDVAEETTPLVEPAEADHEVLVTFVWRGDPATSNVRVVSDDVLGQTPDDNAMVRLAESDVWHKTYRLDSRLRFEYLLAPNDPGLEGIGTATGPARMASWQPDPLNPNTFVVGSQERVRDWQEAMSWSAWAKPVHSLAQLPEAPEQRWIDDPPEGGKGRVVDETIHSAVLGSERSLGVYSPVGGEADSTAPALLVVTDGWAYREIVPVPRILDNLVASRQVPRFVALILDHPTMADRMRDLSYPSADPPFLRFVTEELVPWARAKLGLEIVPQRTIIAGASNGGDFAALAAWKRPDLFGNVLSQSGTFGRSPDDDPEPEWLARRFAEGERLPLRFYLEAETLETDPGESGVSIVTSNRHLRTVLRAKGYPVEHREYVGGHQPVLWRGTFGDAVIALGIR